MNCIRAATIQANSNHIKSEVTTIATSDNKIAITTTKSNPSINNCTVVNRSIKKTTHFVYNRESHNDS
jgi:hypothetical protein